MQCLQCHQCRVQMRLQHTAVQSQCAMPHVYDMLLPSNSYSLRYVIKATNDIVP